MQSAHLCGCEKDCQWPMKNGWNSHQMKRALGAFKLVQDPLHLQPYLNDQVCGLVTISRSAQYHWNKSLEYMPKIHICFVIRNFLCAHSILVPHDFISGGHSVGHHPSIHTSVHLMRFLSILRRTHGRNGPECGIIFTNFFGCSRFALYLFCCLSIFISWIRTKILQMANKKLWPFCG